MPKALWDLRSNFQASLSGLTAGNIGPDVLIVLGCLFIAVVFAVVFITLAQRRIPTHSAKHVRGRRVYGGSKQFLPLRINQAGVMPIIFASSLLMIPGVICGGLATLFAGRSDFWASIFGSLSSMFQGGTSFMYNVFYVALIFFFCYFWTSISFNPKEMSENLKDHGTFIPGYRPGKGQRTTSKRSWFGSPMLVLLFWPSSQSSRRLFQTGSECLIMWPRSMEELVC